MTPLFSAAALAAIAAMATLPAAAAASTGFAGQATAAADTRAVQAAQLRLMPFVEAHARHRLDLHYEAVVISESLPDFAPPSDARRLFDLTRIVSSGPDRTAWHRLDRLAYRWAAGWGSLTAGRAAVTWGNGLVFNPMDLFNPFAPTDVIRDYKPGDDLLLLELHPPAAGPGSDWQFLLVPRRSLATGDPDRRSSSLAVKAHLMGDAAEWDFLAARHYDETVLGVGHVGFVGDAVWRLDATVTFAGGGRRFLSAIANIDTSWAWAGRNCYGSVEIHYNTFGSGDPAGPPANQPLADRLARGELFTRGRAYLAPSLQVELHPLLHLHLLAVVNLADPSAILLPRLVWSARQNLELSLGGSCGLGPRGTEFGHAPPDRLQLRADAFF